MIAAVARRVSRGKVSAIFCVYDTTSAVRPVDTRHVEQIEANCGYEGFMCYAMGVHARGACPGMEPIRGTGADGSRVDRRHGRSAHQACENFFRDGCAGSVRCSGGRECGKGRQLAGFRVLLSVHPTLPRGGVGLAEFQGGWVSNPPPPQGGVGLCGGPWVYRASATSFFL